MTRIRERRGPTSKYHSTVEMPSKASRKEQGLTENETDRASKKKRDKSRNFYLTRTVTAD